MCHARNANGIALSIYSIIQVASIQNTENPVGLVSDIDHFLAKLEISLHLYEAEQLGCWTDCANACPLIVRQSQIYLSEE